MPDSTQGFTGAEIITHVQSYIGNTSNELYTFLQNALPLAEMRYAKAHDWAFLNKTDLTLTVTSGTTVYALSIANIGYFVGANDIREIFNPAGNSVLVKTDVQTIRRMDPDENDGSTTGHITHWAPVGDNTIMVYPPTFADTSLKIDGKVTPVALSNLANYPTIPYRYQEGFIEYVKWIALDKENDDRATAKQAFCEKLVLEDIADDLSGLGDVNLPRFHHQAEAILDGTPGNLAALYNLWAFNSNE